MSARTAVCTSLVPAGLLLLAATSPLQAQPAREDQPAATRRGTPAPATLVVWNRPIVVFRAPVRQVQPADRAANAARRIEALPADVGPDEIKADPVTVGDLHGVLVSARGQTLFGIVEADLDPTTGETTATAGARAVEELRSVLRARAEQRRLPVLLRGLALSLVATALLALVLRATWRASDRALARLTTVTHRRAVPLLGRDVWPLLQGLERGLVWLTAWSVVLIAVYLWLTFVLHEFPYTRPWGEQLGGYLGRLVVELGTGALHALPGLFTVVVIFAATRFIVRAVDAFLGAVETGAVSIGRFHPDTARPTRRIVAIVIWIFALTVAYGYIPGSDSEAFKAIGIFTGLMISLGSAGFMGHVMSGLVVAYSRALRPGDLVQAGGVMGLVKEVGLLSTKLVTLKREEITIPNAVLSGTTVTNYSRLAETNGAVVSVPVTIGYDQPWRQVQALLVLAAERTPGVRKEPRPYVLQQALGDFAVRYEVLAHIETVDQRLRVLSDLHAQILDAFNEFGVQIMSPAFESQPERAVVVPRSKWYAAPARSPGDGAPADATGGGSA